MTTKCFLINSSNRLVARYMLRFAVPSVKCQGPRLHKLLLDEVRCPARLLGCCHVLFLSHGSCHMLFLGEVRCPSVPHIASRRSEMSIMSRSYSEWRTAVLGDLVSSNAPTVRPLCPSTCTPRILLRHVSLFDDC